MRTEHIIKSYNSCITDISYKKYILGFSEKSDIIWDVQAVSEKSDIIWDVQAVSEKSDIIP